ncbi:MAG: hypothetical protein EOP06_25415 [Proteobacteria bacterium]|nr:MAG: hypothetical protein EOP06_25415 [Pseudomonadota bacterium]
MKKPLLLLLSAVVLSVAFTNCSKVDFGVTAASKNADINGPLGDPPVMPTPTVDDRPPVEEAIKNCAEAVSSGQLVTSDQKIEFKDTRVETGRKTVCEFNVRENLSPKNNYLQARYDQNQNLMLPPNAVLCGVELKSDVQKFKYDDVFFLTFNDRVIASNLKRSVVMNSVDSIGLTNGSRIPVYSYDWLKVRGSSFEGVNNKADDYCVGSEQGQSSCKWPLSQKAGDIQFSFNPEILIHLGLKSPALDQKFGFTITGDNDPNDDCYHEALSFKMKVKYYIQK